MIAHDERERPAHGQIAHYEKGRPKNPLDRPVARLLGSLSNVRQRQHGQWSARCPAHDDTAPSLSVAEVSDGRVLVHCFAGCAVDEIVAASGLEVHDLFPAECDRPHRLHARIPKLLTAAQALEMLHDEARFMVIYGAGLRKGLPPTDSDHQRAISATGRVAFLRTQVMR